MGRLVLSVSMLERRSVRSWSCALDGRVVVLSQGLSDRIVVGGDAPRFCAVALGVCCKSRPTLSSAQRSAWQRAPLSEMYALGLQCRKASSEDTGVFHGRRGA